MTHCRRPTGDKFVILNESITVWRDLVGSGVEGCHLDAPSEFRGVSARFNCPGISSKLSSDGPKSRMQSLRKEAKA